MSSVCRGVASIWEEDRVRIVSIEGWWEEGVEADDDISSDGSTADVMAASTLPLSGCWVKSSMLRCPRYLLLVLRMMTSWNDWFRSVSDISTQRYSSWEGSYGLRRVMVCTEKRSNTACGSGAFNAMEKLRSKKDLVSTPRSALRSHEKRSSFIELAGQGDRIRDIWFANAAIIFNVDGLRQQQQSTWNSRGPVNWKPF